MTGQVTARRSRVPGAPIRWRRDPSGRLWGVSIHKDATVKVSDIPGTDPAAYALVEGSASTRITDPDVVDAIRRLIDAETEPEVPRRPIKPGEWFKRRGERYMAAWVDWEGDLVAAHPHNGDIERHWFTPDQWAANPGSLCDPPEGVQPLDGFMVADPDAEADQ